MRFPPDGFPLLRPCGVQIRQSTGSRHRAPEFHHAASRSSFCQDRATRTSIPPLFIIVRPARLTTPRALCYNHLPRFAKPYISLSFPIQLHFFSHFVPLMLLQTHSLSPARLPFALSSCYQSGFRPLLKLRPLSFSSKTPRCRGTPGQTKLFPFHPSDTLRSFSLSFCQRHGFSSQFLLRSESRFSFPSLRQFLS